MTWLTQNREMRRDRIHNWTLPAFGQRLPDGRTLNVCPQAGACATVCYARNGTYLFPDADAITAAGFHSQDAHDLLAVLHPHPKVGIPANNIPAFRNRAAGRTFAQMQADRRRTA